VFNNLVLSDIIQRKFFQRASRIFSWTFHLSIEYTSKGFLSFHVYAILYYALSNLASF
jgi:hypothetical protein